MVGTTFYAVIEEIRENRLLVQGLEINDINGRGTFELAVGDKTELIWRGVPITVKDLRVGNTVSVTYIGEVLEISPAQVSDVPGFSCWMMKRLIRVCPVDNGK